MEIVERRDQPAATPFVVVLAIVAALLLVLGAVALAHQPGPQPSGLVTRVSNTAVNPDAQDRNEQILAARLGKAEATHGR